MPNAAPTPVATLASRGLSLRVLSRADVGRGRAVWLCASPSAARVIGIGAATGLAIEETGTVERLRVRNPTALRVLIPADVVLEGGRQTRTVEHSVIVPARSIVEIPVRCVEKRRWGPSSSGRIDRFEVTGSLSHGTRATFTRMRETSLASRRSYGLEQGAVWREVTEELTRSGIHSPSESYADVLRGTRAQLSLREPDADTPPPAEANGVVLIAPDRAAWIEVFPSAEHLAASAPSLLAALRNSPRDSIVAQDRPRAPAILAAVLAAELEAIDLPRGTAGEPFALRGAGTAGAVIFDEGRVAHLTATVG